MSSKEQHERNLMGFIDMLKTSMSDVDSFQKDDVASYFLMMRKFFKDYVNENNEKYEVESPLFIESQEARNIQCFFDRMIEIFDKSKCVGFISGMTVLDEEMLEKLGEYQIRQLIDMESIRRQQSELFAAYSNRMEELLREIGVKK
jgi:hypothetical protein